MRERTRSKLHRALIAAVLAVLCSLCLTAPAFIPGAQVHAAAAHQSAALAQASDQQYKDDNGITWSFAVLPDGGASITGCDRIPENGLLVLPFQVEADGQACDVTEVGAGAFDGYFDDQSQYAQLLQHVVIPDTVTKIGSCAFWGCSKLETVRLSDNLRSIGSNGFSGCPIKEIAFPDSLSEIGGGAFQRTDLTSVTIPASADFVMSNGAFWECPDLTEFIVPQTNPNYIAIGGVIYTRDQKTLVAYPCGRDAPAFAVPEGVTALNEMAFYHSELQEIQLPDSLTAIGPSAFYGCKQLTSIHVPAGVQKLEQACFGYCEKLTDLELPDTVTTIGSHAFRGCHSLQTLTLPQSVTKIEEYAFFELTSVDSLAIPESVTRIEPCTFQYMVNLQELYLPEGITSISADALEGCSPELKIFSESQAVKDLVNTLPEGCGIQLAGKSREDFEAAVAARREGPAHVHVLEHKMAIEATCTYFGRIDHYYCSTCKKCFTDASATEEISDIYLPRLPHDLKKVPAKAATYEEEGNIEYWICQNENCRLIFADAAAQKPLTEPETVIPVREKTDPVDPTPPNGPEDPKEQTITGTESFTRTIGSSFRLDAEAMTDLSYQSSNKRVATVTEDGTVRVRGYGACVITVTAEATPLYRQAVRTIKIKGRLARPVLKAVNKPGKKIKLSWGKVIGTRGYLLYVKVPGDKKYRLAVSKSARVKSVTHSGLVKGKKYSYKLRAYVKVGKRIVYSRYSKPVTLKVKR